MSEAGDATRGDPSRGRRLFRHTLALLLILVCGLIQWTSEQDRSLTADEPLHLVRGHVWLWKHSARLSYAHPPLANVLTSLPSADMGDEPWGEPQQVIGGVDEQGDLLRRMKRRGLVQPNPESTRSQAIEGLWRWPSANPLRISQHYFTHDFARARAELSAGRRVMIVITAVFGLFFYGWVYRRWGWPTAMISLALLCLNPTFLAHGRLVTTDMPAMATLFASLAATVAWIERPSWGRVLLFLLATTAMVLTKHSGLVFVVTLSGLLLIAAGLGLGGFDPKAPEPRSAAHESRRRRVLFTFIQLGLVAGLMILAIDAAYFFDRVGLSMAEIIAEPEPHNWLHRRYKGQLVERSFLGALPDPLRLPFPYTWLVGLATVSKQNSSGHGGYFFGLNDFSAHPLYFPVMLVLKTPIGVVGLLSMSLGLGVRRWRGGQRPSVATLVFLAFAAINLISLIFSHINIGVRHALTLLPIMAVFAGRGGALMLEAWSARWAARGQPGPPQDDLAPPSTRERLRRALGLSAAPALVAAALSSGAVALGSHYPAYLGYFNQLVGGSGGGRWISVIGEDWGQDLGDVAALAHEQGWRKVAYFTQFPMRREELEYRGLEVAKIRCSTPPEGDEPQLIHVSDWVRRVKCFTWLDGREPAYFINHNILVFTSESVDSPADDGEADTGTDGSGEETAGTETDTQDSEGSDSQLDPAVPDPAAASPAPKVELKRPFRKTR